MVTPKKAAAKKAASPKFPPVPQTVKEDYSIFTLQTAYDANTYFCHSYVIVTFKDDDNEICRFPFRNWNNSWTESNYMLAQAKSQIRDGLEKLFTDGFANKDHQHSITFGD